MQKGAIIRRQVVETYRLWRKLTGLRTQTAPEVCCRFGKPSINRFAIPKQILDDMQCELNFALYLSNSCHAVVRFNKDGLPLSHKGEGHGIGTRSIAAYAKEQDASVNFYTESNRFVFQMILALEN